MGAWSRGDVLPSTPPAKVALHASIEGPKVSKVSKVR